MHPASTRKRAERIRKRIAGKVKLELWCWPEARAEIRRQAEAIDSEAEKMRRRLALEAGVSERAYFEIVRQIWNV